MKAINLFVAVLVLAVNAFAADALTERLQRGLFEEEANHNLDAAIKEYQSVVTASDEQRKVVATALFRLGECYRKLGRTNEATAFYQRIVRDYSEQEQLAKLASDFLKPSLVATGNKSALTLELERKLATLKVESITQRMEAERLASLSRDDLLNTDVVQKDAGYLSLMQQGMAISQKSTDLKSKLADNHPEVQALNGLRKKLIEQIDERLKTIVAGAQERARLAALQVSALGDELKKAQNETAAAPRPATETTSLTQAEAEELARVKTVARNSPDRLEAPVNHSMSELQYAALNGNASVAEFLLAQGVSANGNAAANRPLYLAAKEGHLRIVKMLVEHGAKVDGNDPTALNAIVLAAGAGHKSVVSYLLEHGADVNSGHPSGNAALAYAVSGYRDDMVEFLLAHGAKPDGLSFGGYNLRSTRSSMDVQSGTPLHRAVANKNRAIAELLIRAGASVNATNLEGQTPLHLAAFIGATNAAALLLEQGAAVEPVTRYGVTPFSSALSERNTEVLSLLLQRGANPNQLIEVSGQPMPALFVAIILGPADLLSALLAAKPDLKVVAADGNTPLFMAIERRSPDMVEALLKAGAEPNQRNRADYLPLIRTVDLGQVKAFEALLNSKADPSLADPLGRTARQLAANYASRPVTGEAYVSTPGIAKQIISAELRNAASQMTNLLQQHGLMPPPPPPLDPPPNPAPGPGNRILPPTSPGAPGLPVQLPPTSLDVPKPR